MCSCGGELTRWCFDCGDAVCDDCGCPVDPDHDTTDFDFEAGLGDEFDDDGEECRGCGDSASYLFSDGLCDGCVIFGLPLVVVTLTPLARYL